MQASNSKKLDQFVIYVRIVDNAGNVTFIGSDGATFDTTAPEIVGVIDGSTYYVTKKVAIDDENLELVTLNGKSVKDVFTLAGDKESAYIIRAVDKTGNLTESERAALGRGDLWLRKLKNLRRMRSLLRPKIQAIWPLDRPALHQRRHCDRHYGCKQKEKTL